MEPSKIFLFFLFLNLSACQKSQVTLYNIDRTRNITLSKSSDLYLFNFDDSAFYVRVSGLMLFYRYADFAGMMVYVYGGENWYGQLGRLHSAVSSVRYPGHQEDISKESITLYERQVFTGRDYLVSGSNFTGTKSWTSLIVTGGKNWTVFDNANFSGNSACLIAADPASKTPGLIQNVLEIPSFGNGIMSGFQSCSVSPNQNHMHLIPFVRAT